MTKIGFCNGKFIDQDEPCITLNDRGFLFGDAVFTTLKVQDGNPQFYEEHIKRLEGQCKELGIIPPAFFIKDVQELILKNEALSGTWRLKIIVTGGDGKELYLPLRNHGKLLMTIAQVNHFPKNIFLTIFPKAISSPLMGLKTLSYLDRLFIMDYAKKLGADDAVTLSNDGYILETAFSNIFWIIGLEVFVPDPNLGFLMGIQLTHQIEEYKKRGYQVHFVKMKFEAISKNAKIFVSNAIIGVVPVYFKDALC